MLNYINVYFCATRTCRNGGRKMRDNDVEKLISVNKKRIFLQILIDCLRTQQLFRTFASSKDKRITNKRER